MLVRPLRPADLVALTALQEHAGETEISAHIWPWVDPESGRVPYFSLTSAVLAQRMAGERAWVAAEGRELLGFVIARSRRHGLSWDVEHIHAPPDRDEAAVALLEHVSSAAGRSLVRRVFLQSPARTRADVVARRAGFQRYVGSALYRLLAGATLPPADPEALQPRPRTRADDHALFQLYVAAVPPTVRSAEALSFDEWLGLRRGRPASARFATARRQYVWELGPSIAASAEIIRGQSSQYVELLIHPRFEESTDRLVRSLLAHTDGRVPIYVSARDYQPALATALETFHFQLAANHDVHARMLVAPVREREPRLVGSPATA